jgi:diadenosine tetraphosphate (Ap4A) HIT family hydrolase
LHIPHWTEVPDYFVWEAFDWASRDRKRILGPDGKQQQSLLAETENFYVIPDQFGIVSGHLLVVPKERTTSIACLDPPSDDEIAWLLEAVCEIVADAYEAQAVVAEHGDCGCATASQAHVHILPIPTEVTPARLRDIINEVLRRRMAGIERITYRGTEFAALEDLKSLQGAAGARVTGRQLQCADLAAHGTYPASARAVAKLERPYVYFRGPGIQFVSPHSFRSQFVREVVAIAWSQPPGEWDRRRANVSRKSMLATFGRLATAFEQCKSTKYGFRARGGRLNTTG